MAWTRSVAPSSPVSSRRGWNGSMANTREAPIRRALAAWTTPIGPAPTTATVSPIPGAAGARHRPHEVQAVGDGEDLGEYRDARRQRVRHLEHRGTRSQIEVLGPP